MSSDTTTLPNFKNARSDTPSATPAVRYVNVSGTFLAAVAMTIGKWSIAKYSGKRVVVLVSVAVVVVLDDVDVVTDVIVVDVAVLVVVTVVVVDDVTVVRVIVDVLTVEVDDVLEDTVDVDVV